jgi:hypothetical protein
MTIIERRPAEGRAGYPDGRLKLLNSAAWDEEVEEVLSAVRESHRLRADDPDWQAAGHFLVRHCREARCGSGAYQ